MELLGRQSECQLEWTRQGPISSLCVLGVLVNRMPAQIYTLLLATPGSTHALDPSPLVARNSVSS